MSDYAALPPRIGCGALAASAIIMSVPLTLATGWLGLYPFVLAFTLAIVAAIGTPILSWIANHRVTWPKVVAGGFVTGALVPALLVLPGPTADEASIGNVTTVANGSYTSAGWQEALTFVGGFGVAGIMGALICWALIHWQLRVEGPDGEVSGGGRRLTFPAVALALLVALAIGAAVFMPYATMDRSCHNPLRNGASSIGSTAMFTLDVTRQDWPTVRYELEAFANARGWSIRANVDPQYEYPWFQASLCTEPGTLISVSPEPGEEGHLSINVTQPQGGNSWQQPVRALQKQFEARWPGKIRYRYDPSAGPRPPWAPPSPTPAPKAPPAAPTGSAPPSPGSRP